MTTLLYRLYCQAYRPGRGLAFHMDKDEALMRSQGLVVTPIFSSVLYLTGGFGEGELPQGGAVISLSRHKLVHTVV